MFIENATRTEQLIKFIDTDHPVMKTYYEIIEKDLEPSKLAQEMQKLIDKDADFYESYIVKSEVLFFEEKYAEAAAVLKEAYERAVMRISDAKGRWPKEMLWEYPENQHILRVLEEYGALCWEDGQIDTALEIFRRILRMNPDDEQGIRFNILAIRMGFDVEEWQAPFEVEEDGEVVGLDADEMHDWFEKHALTFPEEFKWLFDHHAE